MPDWKNINPERINTNMYTHTTSDFLWEIALRTNDYDITWVQYYNNEKNCWSYISTYENEYGCMDLEYICDYDNGFQFYIDLNTPDGRYREYKLDTTYYKTDIMDLYGDIRDSLKYTNSIPRTTNDKIMENYRKAYPYYNSNDNDYTVEKKKTQRKIKADKMLENVKFEFNMQILGEIDESSF